MTIPSLANIAQSLGALPLPAELPVERNNRAAVALILSGSSTPDIFFIRRAPHPLDPWSGDIGFPGGRIDPGDDSCLAAARRETLEEIGVDLSMARHIGVLPELVGDHLPVRISCHVFAFDSHPEISANEEVAESLWLPLTYFLDPEVHALSPVRFNGGIYKRPSVRLPDPSLPVLWGITYRLLLSFCSHCSIRLPL